MSLFGAKTILRIKVYDLLEKHYEENQDDADFDYLYEDEAQIVSRSEKVVKIRKVVEKKPRGVFAKMVSENVKMVYLRKSLVQELVKKSQYAFEGKVLGSFVRIRSDPNDYLQNNPYQLVQVTGVKKEPGTDGFLLQVTNCVKEVSISMLSDDDFSKEECEDLHQRIKNGSLKQPTIVEMEEKARSLHEDQTKHWLGRELASLQKRIAQATEKGWRREYPFIRLNIIRIYLEKRELLQTPEEQSRLLRELPEVIGEELVPNPEASPEAHKSDNEQRLSESPISSIQETSEVRNLFGGDDQQCNNGFLMSNTITTPGITSHAVDLLTWTASAGDESLHRDVEQPANGITGEEETQTKEPEVSQLQSSTPVTNYNNGSQAQPNPSEIIELSDGDEDENCGDGETLDPTKRKRDRRTPYDKEKASWLYKDPQGDIQGPFSLTELKAWNDAEYFYKGFKVWMTGQSLDSAVLLTDVLRLNEQIVGVKKTFPLSSIYFSCYSYSLYVVFFCFKSLDLGSETGFAFTCCLGLLFREIVQRLTGPSENNNAAAVPEATVIKPATQKKKPTSKLHERRQCMRPKLEIVKPPLSFKPIGTTPSSKSDGDKADIDQEEKAIKERRFYLHPSPRSKPGFTEPELLTLFPLTSPNSSGRP
ncbi:BnaC02g01100D [Brassica napus]|uniref:BnaC02g01100D protein n=1 Tax=Brassica napus TaxID=3708 RepID=A0A078I3X8_BRANA|nr:BnaC02g01100D [Brassica napus]